MRIMMGSAIIMWPAVQEEAGAEEEGIVEADALEAGATDKG